MAENNILRAVIQVVDRATGPLRQVMATAGRAMAPLQSLGGRVSRLWGGKEGFAKARTAMTEARAAMGEVGTAASGLAGHISGLLGPLAGLGSAMTLAGLGSMVTGWAEVGGALDDATKRVGIHVEALQELRYAAQMSGVDAEMMDRSLAGLNKRIAEAAAGKNAELTALFKRLGISLKDANGNLQTSADILPDLAEGFRLNQNEVMQTRMATALFGDEGTRLIGMLEEGREGLGNLRQEARDLGIVMSKDAVEAAAAYGDAQDRLLLSIQGLSNTIGSRLLPVIQPMLEGMTEWITANRELIATEVASVVTKLADGLAAVDWTAVIDGARDFGQGIASVVDFMGGWGTAITALVVLINAPLLGAVAGVATAMGQLALLFATNPVLAGVAAIAGAALLIYANWDEVSGYFSRLWAGVRELFSTAAGWIDGQLREILPAPLYAAWQGLIGWYGDLFAAVAKVFTGLAEFIAGVFTGNVAGAAAGIKQAWEGIGDYFETILAPVAAAFDGVWGAISPIIDNIRGGMSAIADSWIGRQLGFGSGSVESDAEASAEVEAEVPPPVRRGGSRGTSPSLVKAAKAAGATGQVAPARVDGEVVTRVEISGAPPGTRVTSKASGVAQPDVAVGYRMGAMPSPIR
jgi:hypothetical protein